MDKNEPECPEWLNEEYAERVLKNSEGDGSIRVTKMTTRPATAKGDNYTSNMVRVVVEYSRDRGGHEVAEKKSMVVKISPTFEGKTKEVISMCGAFETEISMMSSTLARMNEMLSAEKCRLSAPILHTELGDPIVLVIEDLAPLGFRMADRHAGLDLAHCKLAIRALARFHGTSVAMVEKDPQLKERYSNGIFNRNYPPEMRVFFVNGLITLAKEIRNWPELGPSYAAKIQRLSEVGYDRAADCSQPSPDEFNVINHGDCWVNNMLFRYNDRGEPIDHIFVDFQISLWSSPAIDLLYFMYTSTSHDVFLNHQDEILREYLDTLRTVMSKVGCKTQPPSMEALKKSMRDHEFYAVITSFTILPLVLTDKSEAPSTEEMLREEGYSNPTYGKPFFRRTMLRLMPDWNARGLLDG